MSELQSINSVRHHHLLHGNPVVYEDMYVLVYAKLHDKEPKEFLIYPKYWKEESDRSGCVLPIDELGEPIFLTLHQVCDFVDGVVDLMMKGLRKRYEKFQKSIGEIA